MSARRMFPRSNNAAMPRNKSVRLNCDIYGRIRFSF
jgi:hypothetical protein